MFTPPFPEPLKKNASLPKRFLRGWKGWIHVHFERSYTMKMGEIHVPRLTVYVPNELRLVDEILEDRERIYPKPELLKEMLDPLIGASIFTVSGREWEEQRAMVNPAFAHTRLQAAFPVMREAVEDLVARIAALDLSRPVAVEPLMTHVAADVIFRTIFSVRLDSKGAEQIYRAFHSFQRSVQRGAILHLYRLPLFGLLWRAKRHARRVHATFRPIVQARYDAYRAKGDAGPPDILRSLLEARHPETGEPFTLQGLINQVSFIFLAGHETSASALAWALYLLAECPEQQEAILAEIGPEPLTFEAIRKAGALRQVFQETLRLYPPVSFFVRSATRATVMRGKQVEPGSMMVISPWLIQRNGENFPCPHAFDPERFADPGQAEACRRAYLPFGKGPRICTGSAFATQEAMLVLGTIVQKFRLAYPDGPKPEPVSRVTLRSDKGIFVRFEPRG